jgi:Family of unknown function (DUF6665)
MTVRLPRALAPKIDIWTDHSTALDYEIAREKASALGRLGRGLEAALAALKAFDARIIETNAEARRERKALVANAGHALWLFVVQREALGLRDSRQVMHDYAVPPEVQGRMGMLPERKSR